MIRCGSQDAPASQTGVPSQQKRPPFVAGGDPFAEKETCSEHADVLKDRLPMSPEISGTIASWGSVPEPVAEGYPSESQGRWGLDDSDRRSDNASLLAWRGTRTLAFDHRRRELQGSSVNRPGWSCAPHFRHPSQQNPTRESTTSGTAVEASHPNLLEPVPETASERCPAPERSAAAACA